MKAGPGEGCYYKLVLCWQCLSSVVPYPLTVAPLFFDLNH